MPDMCIRTIISVEVTMVMVLNRLTISNDNNKEVIKSKKNDNVVHYADPTDVLMEIVVNHTFRSKISHFLAPPPGVVVCQRLKRHIQRSNLAICSLLVTFMEN